MKPLIKFIFVFFFVLFLGFSIVDDYGVNWDEAIDIQAAKDHYQAVKAPSPGAKLTSYYYGQAFNFLAEAVYQGARFLKNGTAYQPYFYKGDATARLKQFHERIKIKHRLTFAISLLAYAAAAGVVSILCGFQYAWLGLVALAFLPVFWGHSFMNQKDIPFAAVFSLAIYLGALWLNQFESNNQNRKSYFSLTIFSFGYGLLTGLCAGMRIAGLLLPMFIFFAHVFLIARNKKSFQPLWQWLIQYGLMAFFSYLSVLLFYPAYWERPFEIFEIFKVLSNFPWPGPIVFEGKMLPAANAPWYYLVKMIAVTTPVVFFLFFIIGLIIHIKRWQNLTFLKQACFTLLLLQVFALPFIAILNRSTIYDNARHFIFILPAIAALSASAMAEVYKTLQLKPARVFAVGAGAVIFFLIGVDMVRLHPYQYTYFNRFSGGLENAARGYETDYWGLSFKESMEWLNQHRGMIRKVVISGPVEPAAVFADPSFDFDINFEQSYLLTGEAGILDHGTKRSLKKISRPFYFLALNRGVLAQYFPECPEIHRVSRLAAAFSVIKKCS